MFWKKRRKQTATQTRGVTIWLTGLSGAGKTTIGQAVVTRLNELEVPSTLLDSDSLRLGLCADLGYDEEDRAENVRRVAEVAALMRTAGICPVVALMSPYKEGRDLARYRSSSRFIEVYVDTPLAVCRERDPKGLYDLYAAGRLKNLSGVDLPYEVPQMPEITIRTEHTPVPAAVAQIVDAVASLRQQPISA